jgi:3-oxoacyl-[acyl-carrier protein] reductase
LITGGRGALAQALQQELQAAGWKVIAPPRSILDVRDPASVRQSIASLERIDLLVNNAALRRDAPLLKLPAAEWDAVLETNLRGAWLCCRAVFPRMQRQGGGHIVNLGSHTARHGASGQTAYGASKAALLALTQSLAAEGGPHRIRVNAVLPGWMPTPFNQDLPPAVHEAARLQHHLQQFNTPQDTARFIAFLHSMPQTSGQIFQLDSRPGSWL